MDNLQDLLKNKRILLITGGLVVILLILVIVYSSYLSKSNVALNPTQPQQVVELPETGTSNNTPKTPQEQSPEVLQAIKEQMLADQEYSEWQETNETQYPWLRKMPFTSEKYFFYYDLGKNTFIGKLYLNPEDNEDQIKEEIMNKLREEDIAPESYQFQWLVNP